MQSEAPNEGTVRLIHERVKEATRSDGIFAYEPQPITDITWRLVARALMAELRATADEIDKALYCEDHCDVPTNEACPRCGQVVLRNNLGREVKP